MDRKQREQRRKHDRAALLVSTLALFFLLLIGYLIH